ncbi:hypothetical protein WA026_012440 [Henosepilachna vigintioctopunctata]|uniref:C-type lectin domain-containing protein n=1 Tax=Henosepilachna vigintioctopunctata TaxID=420089 RepID=A0AAW1V0M8_9CUCU
MFTLKYLYYILVMKILIYLSGVLSETVTERPPWYIQFGLRDIPNSMGSNQRIVGTYQNNYGPSLGNIVGNGINQEVLKSPLPLQRVGDKYYYFGIYFKANFYQAMQFCEAHGMHLMSLESKVENENIIRYLRTNYPKIKQFWTSGSDLAVEGEFVWFSTGKHMNFTYWIPPQPDNSAKIEHCVQIQKSNDEHYLWNDVVCTTMINFICELKTCSNFCEY